MQINRPSHFAETTHESAPAARMNTIQALRRSVLSCLLWESEFYEDGEQIATRIKTLAEQVDPEYLAVLAIEAREQYKLRHVPLVLLEVLTRTGKGNAYVGDTIARVIQRADELTEFLAIYFGGQKHPISNQVRKGLAKAFQNFDEYQLAKYNRDNAIKLRDVAFLVHPKAGGKLKKGVLSRLVNKTHYPEKTKGAKYTVLEEMGGAPIGLDTPDTWEVALSAGADKKETFERLIREGGLGYLALLRNLRNMEQAGCDRDLVKDAVVARKNGAHRVLPFRFIAAARAAPSFEAELDRALVASIEDSPTLKGRTRVLVDVSGSMDEKLSGKSDLTRMDAAAALASVIKAEDLRVFTFSNQLVEVPARRGMAGVDAVRSSQQHGGTYLAGAMQTMHVNVGEDYDRLIVITDEQSHDRVVAPPAGVKGYMINVASAKNGVGYGGWTHIDGFSESVLTFIREYEFTGAGRAED